MEKDYIRRAKNKWQEKKKAEGWKQFHAFNKPEIIERVKQYYQRIRHHKL